MSLTHVIPNQTIQALNQLYELNLLEPISSESLNSTVFGLELRLPRVDSKDKKAVVVPRISLSYLHFLFERLSEKFHAKTCETVSLLYRAGLGFPKDARLSAYWNAYAKHSQPVHDDIVISEDDLLAVMEAHIAKATSESFDEKYVFQTDVHNHLCKLKRYCKTSPLGHDYIDVEESIEDKGAKDIIVQDGLVGYDTFLVYKNVNNGYKLYAAFTETDGRLVPFVRQVLDSKIPSSIPLEKFKRVSTYIVLKGRANFSSSVKELVVQTATTKDVWNEMAEYDLIAHADFKPKSSRDCSKSNEFMEKYKQKYLNAKNFIKAYENDKRRTSKVKRAKKLVETYDKHRELVRTSKVTETSWRKLNPAKHLLFAVHDIFFIESDCTLKSIPITFEKAMTHLKSCGFNVAKYETVKVTRKLKLDSLMPKAKSLRIRTGIGYKNLNIYDLWFE